MHSEVFQLYDIKSRSRVRPLRRPLYAPLPGFTRVTAICNCAEFLFKAKSAVPKLHLPTRLKALCEAEVGGQSGAHCSIAGR
jgi:hypothetical protein